MAEEQRSDLDVEITISPKYIYTSVCIKPRTKTEVVINEAGYLITQKKKRLYLTESTIKTILNYMKDYYLEHPVMLDSSYKGWLVNIWWQGEEMWVTIYTSDIYKVCRDLERLLSGRQNVTTEPAENFKESYSYYAIMREFAGMSWKEYLKFIRGY